MGNEITSDRKEKIYEAVRKVVGVHADQEPVLELDHFVMFMGHMQQLNEQEKKAAPSKMSSFNISDPSSTEHRYGFCLPYRLDEYHGVSFLARASNALVALVFLFQLLMYLYLALIEIGDQYFPSMNWNWILNLKTGDFNVSGSSCAIPNQCSVSENMFGQYIHYGRIGNLLHLVVLLAVLLRPAPQTFVFFTQFHMEPTYFNLVKLNLRSAFAWNMVLSGLFIAGAQLNGANPLSLYILPAVQMGTGFFMFSPFWWTSHSLVPRHCLEMLAMFVADLLCLNVVRLVAALLMSLAAVLLSPLALALNCTVTLLRLLCRNNAHFDMEERQDPSCGLLAVVWMERVVPEAIVH